LYLQDAQFCLQDVQLCLHSAVGASGGLQPPQAWAPPRTLGRPGPLGPLGPLGLGPGRLVGFWGGPPQDGLPTKTCCEQSWNGARRLSNMLAPCPCNFAPPTSFALSKCACNLQLCLQLYSQVPQFCFQFGDCVPNEAGDLCPKSNSAGDGPHHQHGHPEVV